MKKLQSQFHFYPGTILALCVQLWIPPNTSSAQNTEQTSPAFSLPTPSLPPSTYPQTTPTSAPLANQPFPQIPSASTYSSPYPTYSSTLSPQVYQPQLYYSRTYPLLQDLNPDTQSIYDSEIAIGRLLASLLGAALTRSGNRVAFWHLPKRLLRTHLEV